jgi:LysM repeat protein
VGRHNKPSNTKTILKRTAATAALAGAAVGSIAVAGAGTANAFPGQAGLIRCESGGNPTAVNNTPAGQRAGRPGGLFQIVTGTWLANGGGQFAPTADKAAPQQQQTVADRIYAREGAAPWQCKPGAGPTQFSTFAQSGNATRTTSLTHTPAPTPAPATTTKHSSHPHSDYTVAPATTSKHRSHPHGDYTVVAGDTLSGIAQKFNVPGGWAHLQKLNSQHIPNANLILIGQKIATK